MEKGTAAADDNVAIIGLGNMGAAMARRLAEQGIAVVGCDPSEQARNALAPVCPSVANAAELPAAQTIILSLPSSAQVEPVIAALIADAKSRLLVIDTSTSDPRSTVRLSALLASSGHDLVDAPVSGGPTGAENGTLTIVLGGEAGAKREAAAILAPLGNRLVDGGPTGAGHMAKLANNLMVATNLAMLSEVAELFRSLGFTLGPAIAAVNAGSGRSGVTEVNFPRWIETGAYDSGFAMALMHKDVALAATLSDAACPNLPLMAAVAERWRAATDIFGAAADFNRIVQI